MRVLVSGWFSFDCGHTTAGDLLAKDLVRGWVEEAGHEVDVAVAPPFDGDLAWESAVAADYGAVIFVCGPFRPGWPLTEYLEHFAGRPLIGVNVSMLNPVSSWNPFDRLLERDTTESSRPDITLLSRGARAPVAGLILVHPQSEYAERGRHAPVHELIRGMLAQRDVAVVPIDTRLDVNAAGLRSPAQVEGLIARMDVVVTTRLHGLVLALKNGVPAVAVDPIAGGAKIRAQADALKWPVVFTPEDLTAEGIAAAFDYCLTPDARGRAGQCRDAATLAAGETRDQLLSFIDEVAASGGAPSSRLAQAHP